MSGCIFLALSLFKVREWIINAIPLVLKRAIATGIGAFLALIALKNAGIVVASPATLVQMGDITSSGPLLAILSFFVIAALLYGYQKRRINQYYVGYRHCVIPAG